MTDNSSKKDTVAQVHRKDNPGKIHEKGAFEIPLTLRQAIVLCIFFWAISSIIIYYLACNWEQRGQIGDSFGAINALFSGLALVGLYYAVMLQKTELHESRISFEKQLKSAKQALDLEKLHYFMENEPRISFYLSIDVNNNTYFSMRNNGKDAINLYIIAMDENTTNSNTDHRYYEDKYFPHFSKNELFRVLIADHRIEAPFLRIELMYTNQMGLFISKTIIFDIESSNQEEIYNSYIEKLDVDGLALHLNYKDYLRRISNLKNDPEN